MVHEKAAIIVRVNIIIDILVFFRLWTDNSVDGEDQVISRIESHNGLHTLEHVGEIGLGSRAYELKSIVE